MDPIHFTIAVAGRQYPYRLDHLYENHDTPSSLFRCFYDEISQLNQQMGSLSQDLSIKVKTFALHFFSRGSPLPIMSSGDRIHRSPMDYLRSKDNTASYYRGDGSSILHVFFDVIKDHLEGIDLDNEYSAGLIKPSRFAPAMQIACNSHNFSYIRVQRSTQVPHEGDNCFVDLSDWIAGKLGRQWPYDVDRWDSFLADIQRFTDRIQSENVLLGGVIEFNFRIGIYVFLTRDPIDEESPFYDLISDMLNYRGNSGSYPEMITIKRALTELGLGIITSNNNQQDENVRNTNLSTLQINCNQNNPFYPYAVLLKSLLPELDLQSNIPQVMDAKRKIAISLSILNASQSFQTILNNYHFIMEQFIFLSLFISFDSPLEEIIREAHPVSQKGTILCFNSGMAAIDYIIEAVRTEYPNELNPTLVILEGCYYELKDELRWQLDHEWNTHVQSPLEELETVPDLLILDLFPNNVTSEIAQENPVVEVVRKALEKREKARVALTVVLDTSTLLLNHPKLLEIQGALSDAIGQGLLRLLFVSSLAKFYSCGFDKYTGGVIIYYGQDTELPLKLTQYRNNDPMSDEAISFFSIMIGKAMGAIDAHYERSLQNTRKLYEVLKGELNENTQLRLQPKDPAIPVIGIVVPRLGDEDNDNDRKRALVNNAQESFSAQALAYDYPLFMRASFPFPHSTVIECDTALRWIAGFDTVQNLEYYSQLIRNYQYVDESDI